MVQKHDWWATVSEGWSPPSSLADAMRGRDSLEAGWAAASCAGLVWFAARFCDSGAARLSMLQTAARAAELLAGPSPKVETSALLEAGDALLSRIQELEEEDADDIRSDLRERMRWRIGDQQAGLLIDPAARHLQAEFATLLHSAMGDALALSSSDDEVARGAQSLIRERYVVSGSRVVSDYDFGSD